jgi:hypothetical protein
MYDFVIIARSQRGLWLLLLLAGVADEDASVRNAAMASLDRLGQAAATTSSSSSSNNNSDTTATPEKKHKFDADTSSSITVTTAAASSTAGSSWLLPDQAAPIPCKCIIHTYTLFALISDVCVFDLIGAVQ